MGQSPGTLVKTQLQPFKVYIPNKLPSTTNVRFEF